MKILTFLKNSENFNFFENLVENFELHFPSDCEGIWTRKPYEGDCFDII